jgi:hypothetical protein
LYVKKCEKEGEVHSSRCCRWLDLVVAELLLHHLLDLRLPLLARGAELAVHVVDLLLVHGLDLVDLLVR